MKKCLIIIFTILITPSITFAAWWNIFNKDSKKNDEVIKEKQFIATTSLQSTTTRNTKTDPEIKIITKTVKVTDPAMQDKINSLVIENNNLRSEINKIKNEYNICTSNLAETQSNIRAGLIGQSQNLPPLISSIKGKKITGIRFSNSDSVYIVPNELMEKTNLSFKVIDDSTIYLDKHIMSQFPTGKYKVYVSNSIKGISSPFEYEIPNKGEPYRGQNGVWYYPNIFDENGNNLPAIDPILKIKHNMSSVTSS